MKLRELIIKNYGCIGENELRVVIDDIIVLIGPNNVGKTTVLNAYESFAGSGVALDKNKFHKNSTDSPIEISGIFSDITDEDKIQIGEKWIFNHPDYNECIKYKYVWEKENTKGVKYSWNNEEEQWKKGGMGGWDTKIASCIPVPIKINPLDSPEELQKQIIEILSEAIKEKSRCDDGRIKDLIDNLNKIAEEVKKEIEDTLDITTDKLEENMKNIFPDCKILIKPQAGKFEPEKIIASGSHIRIKDLEGNDYPLSSQGAGLQRTFLWSAIEALSEAGNYKKGKTKINNDKPRMLLIEEPESFLHPPAVRLAREALYKIAELDNWQVMITTHSPIFIDVSKPHTTIIRVEKNEGATKIFSTEKAQFSDKERERLQMIRNCHPTINEFFFANKVILVEGDTEQVTFSQVKEERVTIINCRGKANIPMFEKILNHFGVEYIAVHDLDTPKSKRDGKFIKNSMWTINEKIIEEANKGLNGKVIVNIPDFERQFFGYLQSGDKPYNAILELQKEERRNVRDELEKIANGSLSEKYEREITNVSDYKKLGIDYCNENDVPMTEIWEFD